MDAKLIVTLELKEVQNAVIEAARTKIGDSKGSGSGSSIRFCYNFTDADASDARVVTGAEVSFQYVKK